MYLNNALVTGGAGFIGSHLSDKLVTFDDVEEVRVFDNLSSGCINPNLLHCINSKRFRFIKGDLKDIDSVGDALKNITTVFHLAAYPEVRTGFTSPEIPYNENIRNTFYLLEKIRKSSKVESIVFSSSSTVYGEPEIIPTPEDYGAIIPISAYGASKLACEALISSYCHTYGIKGWIYRLANVVGARSRHGIIFDFTKKLMNNNKEMVVLGNGLQSKSYIHISDCIACMLFCLRSNACNNGNVQRVKIFNIGNDDNIDVFSIAKIICNTMGLEDVKLITTSGWNNDGRGWIGDVKHMQLDISKLKRLGWNPKLSSEEAVRLSSKEILSFERQLTIS